MALSTSVRHSGHSRAVVVVHIVWSTYRRHGLLVPEMDGWLTACMQAMALRVRAEALAVGAGWDHVHVVARLHPTTALSTLVQQLKGASSHEWNAARGRQFALHWQNGYWAESCTPDALAPLLRYVAGQREHHATSKRKPEAWEAI